MSDVYIIATSNPNIVGDGINDDSVGWQELFDIARDMGSVMIIAPPLKYRMTQKLYVSGRTEVKCAEGAEFIKDHDGLFFTNNRPDESYSGYAGNSSIKVTGGLWDCQAPVRGGGTPFPMFHAFGLTFRDMVVRDCNNGHAFEFNACKHWEVKNCRFEGFYGDQLYEEAIQLDLAKPPGGVAPWFPGEWDNTACEYGDIIHCYFGPSEKNGSWGRGIGSHSATVGAMHRNIRMLHNEFDRTLSWGIKTYNYEWVTLHDNHFYHCRGGISIDPIDPSDSKDTINTNGTQTNGSQSCTDITLTENKFYGSDTDSWSGISLGGYSSGVLRNIYCAGNMFNGSRGIWGNYLSVATFVGNTFHNIRGGDPIDVDNNSQGKIVKFANNF